jgi:hypothetical protein
MSDDVQRHSPLMPKTCHMIIDVPTKSYPDELQYHKTYIHNTFDLIETLDLLVSDSTQKM